LEATIVKKSTHTTADRIFSSFIYTLSSFSAVTTGFSFLIFSSASFL